MLMPVFSGCITLYVPNAVHSPMLKEKGDTHLAASLGLSGSGTINLQAATAISDHTGLMTNGMFHNRRSDRGDSSREFLNIFFMEAGAGHFSRFGEKSNGLFQIYAGGGYGYSGNRIKKTNQPEPEVNAKYFNIFLQPGLAVSTRYFDLAFDVRTNYIKMFDINAYLYEQFEWWNTEWVSFNDTTLYFVNIEPVMTMKMGEGPLKAMFQLGFIIPTINTDAYFLVNNKSLLIAPLVKVSVGVTYSLNKR